MSAPKVAAVPVHECGERLVDVRRERSLLVDERKWQEPAGAFAYLREGVLDRLQRRYFDEYAGQLCAEHPEWTAERVRSAASRYVSSPEIAPHSAGAAVDLTLAGDDGRELEMGTRINATPEESAGACYTQAGSISDEARSHRDILGTALAAVGLVNYPTEWWHWSFGDRYWARPTSSCGRSPLASAQATSAPPTPGTLPDQPHQAASHPSQRLPRMARRPGARNRAVPAGRHRRLAHRAPGHPLSVPVIPAVVHEGRRDAPPDAGLHLVPTAHALR